MAGAIPKSLNIPKKVIITVAIAITPKSSGEISRARIADTTNDISIPVYLEIAVKNMPDSNCSFIVIIAFYDKDSVE